MCFEFFPFETSKCIPWYRRRWSWVITSSLLLSLTVKIKNIGAVICPASCRTSEPLLTAVKIFALVITTIRLWCSVHLRLCLSARVGVSCHRRSSIDRQLRFVDLSASLRSVLRAAASARLHFPTPLIVYPLHHAQSKIQVVTTIVLFVSLHTVRVGFSPPPISYRSTVEFCRTLTRFPSLRTEGCRHAAFIFHHPSIPYTTIQDTCHNSCRPLQLKYKHTPAHSKSSTTWLVSRAQRWIGSGERCALQGPHREVGLLIPLRKPTVYRLVQICPGSRMLIDSLEK